MNKTTYYNSLLVLLFLLLSFEGMAQTYKTFTIREKIDVRGSMLVVGNAILGQDNNDFNFTNQDNQDIDMQYIDIDSDPLTFSSSSADIVMPLEPDGSVTSCYRVAYAGLYWGAILQDGDRSSITNIKFKIPGASAYNDISGELIYDAVVDPIFSVPGDPGNTPYACYADVTDIVSGLTDIEGTYTVANITSSEGFNASTGLAAGWTLVLIYEDPNLNTKSFNLFDGFSHIYDAHYEEVPVSGFTTPPAGNIDLQFAYAALDGDRTKRATKLEINGKEVTTPLRSANKFFGSVIENRNGVQDPRVPFSENTLGFDTGFLEVQGAEPEFITNNQSNASFVLQVARGQADPIFAYFGAFAVDIIAPDINLTKTVSDTSGNDIDGAGVNLGQQLFYDITYQSVGNDNVTNFTIKDILPDNIIFDPNTDIDLTNAGGATLQSYDPATRTIIFNIPDGSVEVNDPSFVIRLAIQVVPDCYSLSQACSNEILNQAFATYQGVINPAIVEEEGSFANTECLSEPGPTNFIVDISNCDFQKNEILCGESVVLTAAAGYDSYSWSTDPSGSPVIAMTQTYTATQTGTYYVTNTTNSTCISINETFTVSPYGSTTTNPVIPYADLTPICPNDGKVLPYIFLCGANDTRAIQTNISDAVSIIWEKLDETSCPEVGIDDCANENDTCTWNQVATGPDYTANDAGQFRLVINYPGGCFSIFYFNVYQNLLDPTISGQDIICTTPGSVTAGNVPSGYEFSLDPAGPFQASNTFNVTTPGYYTIYLRQTGANSFPCIFETPRVYVRERDFSVTSTVTQPVCNGDTGSIQLAVNNALPQYYFSISSGGTQVDSVGPINASDYTFDSLNPGTYTVDVSTDDGCVYTEVIDLIEPALLTATAALTQPLTCTNGEITVTPNGGTPPYQYYVNGNTISQDSNIVVVPAAGTYEITVLDFNNCSTSVSLTVDAILPPEFTISQTDILCADDPNSGTITINVTNANGNTLAYSIDNGVTFENSPNFTGLAAGSYDVVLQYTIDGDVCTTAPQTITITAPSPITGSASLTTPFTCTTDGIITVSGVSGGTPPYLYSIDGINFQTGTTFGGLTAGTYSVTIQDANNCATALAPITIDPLDPPTDLTFSSTALTCPANTSTVTLTAAGGISPLEYQITAPSGAATAYQSSNSFPGLAPGTYTFQVRDANDCTYSEAYTIAPLPTISVVGQVNNDITCFGASDGSATFTVSGSTNFTYTINGGASQAGTSPISVTGLAAGDYTVVITDNDTSCTATDTVTINTPTAPLSLTTSVTPLTCFDSGSVTVTASGGWGNYVYELEQPDNSIVGPQSGNIFTNLSQPGIYTVTVIDANGCVETATFSLTAPVAPIATIDASSDFCYDGTNGSTLVVNASGGQPPYEYSINGSAFGNSNTFSNLTPGTYDIVVRDAYGCTFTVPTQTIADQLQAAATLSKGLDCSATPDAVITGTMSGGYPPYTVTVTQGTGTLNVSGSTFTLTTDTTGNYEFQIVDSLGCLTLTNIVTINPVVDPTATTTTIDVSCNGGSDGSVQILASDGVPPYTYSFEGSPFTATSSYGGLSAGTYNYQVRDANECIFDGSVTINEPTALVVSASATDLSCAPDNTSQAAIVTIDTPTTGTAPYLYSFNGSGYSSNNTLTVYDNGADQTITFSVQDANGCISNGSLIINRLDPPTDLDFSSTAITCTATTSTITLTATNGVGTLQYETISPSPVIAPKQTSNTFSGLPEGTYVFRVTDANGCYYTESYTIDPVTPIAVTGTKLSDVLCNGDTSGALEFRVYDFTTFTYTINGGPVTAGTTPINLTGLVAGDYTIVVTDSTTGCTATETITINEPANPLALSATASNINCNDDRSAITITASGGTPNYKYAAVTSGSAAPTAFDYFNTNILNVDTNGGTDLDWDVYVKDLNNCIALTSISINSDPLPTVTAPTVDNQCTTASGFTFTVSATGVAPLMYSINGGASYQSSPTFTVNAAGNYTITVMDGNGCTASSSTTTDVFPPITVSAILTKDITCAAPADATIDVSASGGDGSYSYEVSADGGTTYTPFSGTTFSTSTPGTYQFRVTDGNGCSQETSAVNVNAATPVATSVSTIDPTCNGGSDGSITLTPTSGEAPFTFSLDNGLTFGSTNVFGGLVAGTYNYVVRDNKGCEVSGTANLTDPAPYDVTLTATPIECAPISTPGSIDVTINSGGVGPFTYTLYDNTSTQVETNTIASTTYTFNNLTFGEYYVTIVDANGCEYISTYYWIETPPFLDLDANTAGGTCVAGATVDVSVNSGGTPDFIYSIYGQPGTETAPTSSNTYSFTGLEHGVTYYFKVEDSTGCFSIIEVTTPTLSNIVIDPITATNVTCFGASDGSVSFTVTDYDPSVTALDYEVRDAITNNPIPGYNGSFTGLTGSPASTTITGLPAGSYRLFVQEANGTLCNTSETFRIIQPAQGLSLTLVDNVNATCNADAQVTVSATGGTGPYIYAAGAPTFNPNPGDFGSSNVLYLDPNIRTNWEIVVEDANGCQERIPVSITTDPEPTINPVPQQCFDGTPFTITLVEGTGTAIAPLTYSIGGAYQNSPNFTISAAGTYTISVKDGNGCIASTTYVVEPPLLLDADLTQDLTCSVDASIDLTASGGSGTYNTYEWSNDGGATFTVIGGTTFTTATDGTYIFRVTDDQGCQALSQEVVVTPQTTPTFTYSQSDVTCNGGADGSIVITAADGIAPYQYSIDGGSTFQTSNTFTGLAAGIYDVVVRDAKDCDSGITQVTITEPALVGGSGTLTQSLSCGSSNQTQPAIITITGSGGTAPYMYSFDGGVNYTSTNTYTTYIAGTVTAYVMDANGCIIVTPIDVVVPALDRPTDLDFSATAISCIDTTSDVTLTATNGVGPLSYQIISPASATGNTSGVSSGVFTGLAPDTYVFMVTDANGCYYSESFTINPVTNITVSGILVSAVTCNGSATGAVDFSVGNFSTTYSYTINGGAAVTNQTNGTISLTGLPAGDQIIVVTDDTTGCQDTFTVTVTEPAPLSLAETQNINANCNFGAQVTVEASGGTPPYMYAFVQDGTPPSVSNYTNNNSVVLDPAVNTQWDAWVEDANGCLFMIDITIDTDPAPVVSLPLYADDQCTSDGTSYTFTATPGGSEIPPVTYSIDGVNFQISPTFTVTSAGTYTVTIKDGNNCTSTDDITIYPPLDLTPTVTAQASCADNDGEITVEGFGGTGNYTYSISPNPGSITLTGNVFSGVPSGTYTVTITDTVTSCTSDVNVTLDPATPVTFTTAVTDVNCFGGSDGTITVNLDVSNDNPPYTYEIIAPIVVGPQSSNIFTGLAAGTYSVRVNSGRGCFDIQDVIVGEPLAPLAVSAAATEFACAADNSVNTSIITITGTGGTTPYTYSIDGTNYFSSNTFEVVDNGSVQNITVYIRDANGCAETNTVTIQPLPALTAATVATVTPIDCNGTGSISINVTGGSGNFNYQMLPDGTPQASNIFAITEPGDYYFQVTDLDTGCSIVTDAYTVPPFDTIEVQAIPTSSITCFGDTNGSLEFTVIGYTGNYTYEVLDNTGTTVLGPIAGNTSTNPLSITGLSGGNYSVRVTQTDSPFCVATSNVITIASPSEPLVLTAAETSNVTCDNNAGTITATATGGWGGYEYELTGSATVAYSPNGTFRNLSAGTYTVNVRDAGGCIASQTLTLVIPPPITATVTPSTTVLSCFGDTDAVITVSGQSGGQGSNYSYILHQTAPTVSSSGPQASPVFSGLGAGTYYVEVIDGYNCSYNAPDISITEPTEIQADLVKSTTPTCTTDAQLTLSANGGTGSYQYSDDPNFGTVLGSFTSSTTFSVTPGTYQYYVRDANACVANVSNAITVDPLPPLVINLDLSNARVNCAGDTTGVIVAEAEGGLGNYVYTLQDGSGNAITPVTQDSPGVFTNLPAGTYQVVVSSGDCLETSAPITITEPGEPLTVSYSVTNAACFGESTGILDITASGGTGVIKYAISPRLDQFFDTASFDDLPAGMYQALVQDELGCYVIFDFEITEPAPVSLSIVPNSLVPEACTGDMNGAFSVEITGGTLPYSVSLDNIDGPYTTGGTTQTQFDFTGLAGGNHIVYVMDAQGCFSEWNIDFPASVQIEATVAVEYCRDINDASTNTVVVTVDDSLVDLNDIDYSLDGGAYQVSNIFTDVVPGNHYITVRHTNTCEKQYDFTVDQYDPLTISIADGELNQVVIATTGGSGEYDYTVTLPNGTTESIGSEASFYIYESGNYTVTVTDSNGCIASASGYFEYIDICITNYFTPNGDGQLDQWGPDCANQFPNLTYNIYDRYGRRVATLRQGQKWDGKYDGKELPTGDYWYVIELNDSRDERSFVGHFTLYR